MILEVAILDVKPELAAGFEDAFREASRYIAATPGYVSHELQRCVEDANRYLLLVRWQTLEAHTEGFRGSERYAEWRRLRTTSTTPSRRCSTSSRSSATRRALTQRSPSPT